VRVKGKLLVATGVDGVQGYKRAGRFCYEGIGGSVMFEPRCRPLEQCVVMRLGRLCCQVSPPASGLPARADSGAYGKRDHSD
jgi:hypothetical protein